VSGVLAFLAGFLGATGAVGLAGSARPRRVGIARLLTAAGRRVRPGPGPRELDARIAAAGLPSGLGARELMAFKVALALAAGALATAVAAAAPGRLGPLLVLAAPPAAFLSPDLWLARMGRARARSVRRELPTMLDLLRLAVEAGGSLAAALGAVGARSEGPLAGEWRSVGAQVALGVPLRDALEAMTRRLPQAEVRSLVAALQRAARHGAPLAATLAGQARDARLSLRRRVAEDAARAGPKIQLVVALLLVPSVLLLVAAALVSALLDGDAAGAGLIAGE
jgi:tight adherence protein C